jgi:DNA-binding beta-propeller fold protein YncE
MGFTNGNASEASFSNPMGLAVDSTGNVYVADSRNNERRRINTDGVVTTLAGGVQIGPADGNGNLASFFNPIGIAVDSKWNVYVADSQNNLVRKLSF